MPPLDPDSLDGLSKYRPLSLLGQGGMGEVYLCEHAMLGHRVVVKVLRAGLATRPTTVERMRVEAQALAALRHPNLVRVLDFDETPDGRPFFVMEYLPGRSLADEARARGGSLPVAEAASLILQACAGLGFAHERGLVHRDVKPDNLFVCDAPSPGEPRTLKVLDFGVAKLLADATGGIEPLAVPTAEGMVVGTPRFFAPEQARGLPLDARADLYALGLSLYVLLAGRGPFDECSSLAEIARAHLLETPRPPSDFAPRPIPVALELLVLRCVAKRPEDRPGSARALAAELVPFATAPLPR